LQLALTGLSTVEAQTGQLRSAQARSQDSRELAESIGWSAAKVAVLANPELLAWQGHDQAARVATENLMTASTYLRASDINRPGYRAMMVLHLGHGHYQDGFDVASQMHALDALHFDNDCLPNLIEAGVRSDHVSQASAALVELTERATASGTPWATGLLARGRALLSDDPEPHYQISIANLEKTSVITELARSHLLYGEWLRRRKRKNDARLHLRLAFDLLTDNGAVAFIDRTTLELRATGDRVITNRAERDEHLTPQETHVVQLAADGATNQMIAAELFISTHTVGYHLTKAFRKLGVTSRAQLHLVLKP
jgi:DNA-binding CsgD family transcriptional regulator